MFYVIIIIVIIFFVGWACISDAIDTAKALYNGTPVDQEAAGRAIVGIGGPLVLFIIYYFAL